MGAWHKPVKDVLYNAEHYAAIGQTDIWLDENDPDLPWADVVEVSASGSYRLNGPNGFRCVAKRDGLTLQWSVDFETRGANGASVHMFDRDKLRAVMMRMPAPIRQKLATWMEAEVMPGIEKTTAEWREYLNRQLDSEDCVRGLIAYAKAPSLTP
jgi:hypothetical protein